MIRKILSTLIFLTLGTKAFTQQSSNTLLTGRWQTRIDSTHIDDLLFISDDRAAIVTPDNRICAYFNYKTKADGKSIILSFSFDVDRKKNPRWQTAIITFLNDSVFVCHATHVLAFSSYLTKKDRTYTRIKTTTRDKDLRMATFKDMKGRWVGYHLNNDEYVTIKKKDMELFFIDEDHIVEMHQDSAYNGTYHIDLSKQPSPIEFTYTQSGRTVQALLMFLGTDKMRIQWFPNSNRDDHFTEIGYSMWLVRPNPAEEKITSQ